MKITKVVALVAALVVLFISFTTAVAEDIPEGSVPGSVTSLNGIDCYDPNAGYGGSYIDGFHLVEGTPIYVVDTTPDDIWVTIYFWPIDAQYTETTSESSWSSCSARRDTVEFGMGNAPGGEEVISAPEEPDISSPPVLDPTDSEPTESGVTEDTGSDVDSDDDYVADDTESDVIDDSAEDIDPSKDVVTGETEGSSSVATVAETPAVHSTVAEVSIGTTFVNTLPNGGVRSGLSEDSYFGFSLRALLLALGIPTAVLLCLVGFGLRDTFRDYKEGVDTPASRTWAACIWSTRTVLSISGRAASWALTATWLYPYALYLYCAEHRGRGHRAARR